MNDSFATGAKSGWGSLTADGVKVTVGNGPVFFPSDPPRRPHMPRKTAVQYPPLQNIRCLGMILSESGDSGRNPGLRGRAKIAVSSTIHEGFLGGGKK